MKAFTQEWVEQLEGMRNCLPNQSLLEIILLCVYSKKPLFGRHSKILEL